MFKYALSVSAIGAGTALLNDFSKTGEIRPHKALDFLSDSQFFKSSLGIFVGSTMLSTLGNFLPSGIGPVLKTVPGFWAQHWVRMEPRKSWSLRLGQGRVQCYCIICSIRCIGRRRLNSNCRWCCSIYD